MLCQCLQEAEARLSALQDKAGHAALADQVGHFVLCLMPDQLCTAVKQQDMYQATQRHVQPAHNSEPPLCLLQSAAVAELNARMAAKSQELYRLQEQLQQQRQATAAKELQVHEAQSAEGAAAAAAKQARADADRWALHPTHVNMLPSSSEQTCCLVISPPSCCLHDNELCCRVPQPRQEQKLAGLP